MAERQTKPLLDLDTLIERPTVRIDGVSYEMHEPGELSVLDFQRLNVFGRRVDSCLSSDEPTTEELARASAAMVEICKLILMAPEEVQIKLSDGQRFAIMGAFKELERKIGKPSASGDVEGVPQAVPPTGEK